MCFMPAFIAGECCMPLPFGGCGLAAPDLSPGADVVTLNGDSLRHDTEGFAGTKAFALMNTLRAKLHEREHYPMRYGSVEEYALKYIAHELFEPRAAMAQGRPQKGVRKKRWSGSRGPITDCSMRAKSNPGPTVGTLHLQRRSCISRCSTSRSRRSWPGFRPASWP